MNYPYFLLSDVATLAIIFAVAFLVGALILILSGLNHVRKGYIYIVEKMNSFDRVLTPGFHYLAPFVYSIAARYSTLDQKATVKYGSYGIEVAYKIEDVKAYHYAGHCFLEEFDEILKKDQALTPEALQNSIIDLAKAYSIGIIAIDIYFRDEEAKQQ